MEHAFKNAQVVTEGESFLGSVLVRDGRIVAVDRGAGGVGEDLEGDVLMPGVIDLHTDNLEKHFFPRPNIDWNPVSAAVTHDGCCLSVGVTTVFDSLSIGSFNPAVARNHDNMIRLVDGVLAARDGGMLKGDHRLHWRCETPADDLPDRLEQLAGHSLTALFSLMDHTPGQRQYRNLEKHLANWSANGMSDQAIDTRMAEIRDRQGRNAVKHRRLVAEIARDRLAPLASHDDEDVAHIDDAADLGATVAEFPVTVEAARRARERGMIVVMGGPNLIRGGSYSGNVPAAELADADLLDAFASDYVPRSLIECAFALTDERFGWSLAKAVALVTAGPARAAQMEDRGVIEPGRRADLVRVRIAGGLPVIRGVWVEGARAA
ncbi:alpha-D-ribose 1-methylphosphonate 5-triphosphate diphosphatase [Phenylobacterium sp. LH3H17]|uniref:alpha-D-ribose 1-methylphosphonate 5-triphosphate diphosphatase n=1 Tax=Phenylobacterium sp. LH3H17 TaxID=2903901 RepID=UPI0020CA2145|nr:alpha-D-ribose 1-methylphosphonate 5-triphosphate diphosphatase [Phenylobacterium sp. LH3H17]UTP38481.1 alpha-D-ribose 1-methylphosphonate 5-triphosphate diphosphatase [Phenylobacterium sp. LH3H17]